MKILFYYPAVLFIVLCLQAKANAAFGGKSSITGGFVPAAAASSVPVGDGQVDGKDHPCYRQCDGKTKTCFYHFHVEWYQSMSKACYDCPFNSEDCERKDCVVTNGFSRQITVINRKMPGPSIEVCVNDKIIVNVTNELMGAGTAIHWHGMHQIGTPFMDGVPYVTQCPGQPEATFSYEFTAAQAGTHFYHSHIGLQRGDGVTGPLIVRSQKSRDTYGHSYNFDKSDHVIQIQDWTNRESQSIYTNHYHSAGSMSPSALLINGRGRFEVKIGTRTTMTKAPRFDVAKGYKYRFRLINEEFYYCPVELTVDGHELTVIASDGWYVDPVTAKSIVSYAGERFDFIINADQKIDNYWIRIRGLMNCLNSPEVRQVAVLHYRGSDDVEPPGAEDFPPRVPDKTQINPENQGDEQDATTIMSRLRYPRKFQETDDTLKLVPDYKFYVAYDLYIKDNDNFNKAPLYGHEQVKKINESYSVPTPQLNHISMRLPKSPLLVARPSAEGFCNESSIPSTCKETFCQCPHVLSVKLNSVVEVVIIDEGSLIDANHPFHLHGHNFRVIGMRRLGSRTSVEEVKALDRAGNMDRNLKDRPPVKDTVTVPDGGYTIIRFKATNPGYWLFHCHIEFHAEVGMALAFKVGEHEDMTPIPRGFPTCGDYKNNGETESSSSGSSSNINNVFVPQNQPGRPSLNNNMFANIAKQFNAYHSLVNMPMGGQMEIVYRPPETNGGS